MNHQPRPEYPRPSLVRPDWLCLNGPWEFEIDNSRSGRARNLHAQGSFSQSINLPFCPESELSGIGNKDFMEAVWYHRQITLPEGWQKPGRRTLLHVGACDYQTEVFVNGTSVGTHIGGYISFSFDITDALTAGENRVVICAEDHLRENHQPAGKQSTLYHSYGCCYTRTTGIWQTVWLENVPASYLERLDFRPALAQKTLFIKAICHQGEGQLLTATASYQGKPMGQVSVPVTARQTDLALSLEELHLWEPGNPCLYDLTLTLGEDRVESYFGMREIACVDGMLLLNGKPLFQRLVLDQGFYPDGIYTAPTDEALKGDILLSMQMGFNGARLHQKIFEPRFLYHCDQLGYLVWGEHANWGLDLAAPEAWQGFIPEWLEAVERDCCHPSIVGWCPLNETQQNQNPALVKLLVDLTRAADGTRPVIDASGWSHEEQSGTDLLDIHDYEQNPAVFDAHYRPLAQGEAVPFAMAEKPGHPTFMSEYGGILWKTRPDADGWGYGDGPKTKEEFIERYRGLTLALLNNPAFTAFCYTQLTDVEQEQNGLYTYDRQPKFDPQVIAAINRTPAAMEQQK